MRWWDVLNTFSMFLIYITQVEWKLSGNRSVSEHFFRRASADPINQRAPLWVRGRMWSKHKPNHAIQCATQKYDCCSQQSIHQWTACWDLLNRPFSLRMRQSLLDVSSGRLLFLYAKTRQTANGSRLAGLVYYEFDCLPYDHGTTNQKIWRLF